MIYFFSIPFVIYTKTAYAIPVEFIATKTIGILVLALIFLGLPFLYILSKDRNEDKKKEESNLKKYGKSTLVGKNEDPFDVGKQYYKIANSAYLSGDYKKAKLNLEMCLEILNHSEALYLMGLIYKKGCGLQANENLARDYFLLSFEADKKKERGLKEIIELLDDEFKEMAKEYLESKDKSLYYLQKEFFGNEEKNPYFYYFNSDLEISILRYIILNKALIDISNAIKLRQEISKSLKKEDGVKDLSIWYRQLVSNRDKSKLLLLFYDVNIEQKKSIYLEDEKLRQFYYECFS